MRRLPVYILVDCSASMVGEPVEAVKVGLDKLLSSLRRDPFALESVYLSLIKFDEDAHVLVPITELSDFHCPEITLSNNTKRNLGLGLQLLLTRCKKEVKRTTSDEKGDWLPIVVLMTSGDPNDLVRFKNVLPHFKKYPFAEKIVCVTGMKSKTIFLNYFTHDIFSLETMDSHAFSKHWQWVSKVINQSQSANDGGDSTVFPTLEVNKKTSSLPPLPPSLSFAPSHMPPLPTPQKTKKEEQELSLKKLATDIVIVLAVIVFAIIVLVYFLGFPQRNAVLQNKITELQKEIVELQKEIKTHRNQYRR